jgi:(p)ppGpp synthase/HD superfamily hydrolase
LCVLSYSHLLSDKLEHITNHQIKVKANNVKDHVDKIKEIVTGEGLDIIKIKYGKDNNENKELVLELRAKGDINLNEIYSKISKIDGIEEIEELKNTAVPSN